MPLDNEKLKKVYSTLKEGGYDQDYNTFVKGFSGNENYGKRKQVYDLLSQNGAQVGKNYADFMQRLYTPSPKPKQTQAQVQQPRVNRGSMVRAVTDPLNARGIGGVMQNINKVQEVVKKAEKEKENGYQPRFDGVTKRNTEAKIPTLADLKPIPTFEPAPHFDTEESVGADGKIVSKAKPKQIFDGSGQPKYVYQDSFTGKTYDPNDSDPHTQEMIKRGEDAASYVRETPMLKEVTDNDLVGLASSIDKRMREIEIQRNAEAGTSDWSGLDMPRGGGALVGNWYTSTQNGLLADEEYKTLGIAQGALARAHKMVEEAEKSKREGNFSGFIKGAGRGFVDGVFDPETWDFGVSSLAEAGYVKNALDKFDSGQQLSKEDKVLLDAKAMEMAVNAFYGSDLGRGYKAGKVTAEAIPFMIEMAINPASGAGKSAASMLTRYALKRFGKKGLVKASKKAAEKAFARAEERALAKGLSEAAAKAAGKRAAARATKQTIKFQAAKTGARLLGDVAGASTMAATTGAMRTAADAVSRHSGDVKFDVDNKGHIVFAGHDKGDDWGTAVKKAFANTAIENYSEMFGAYFAPIGSFVGKAGEKLLSKIGLGKVTEMLGKLSSSDIAKAVKRIEEKGQFNGVIGEDLEEQVGGIMNALIVGDQTLDTADGTGVFNMDNQINTLLGVGLMGGIFSAARLGGGLVGGQGNLEARRAVRQAGVAALKDFKGKELIWDKIKSDVDNASNDQLEHVVKNIVTDGGLSDDNKKAALQYVRSSMHLRGFEAIRPLTKEEEEADAHNVQEEAVHNRGFEADAQERKDIAIESADPDNAEAQQAWAGVEQRIDDDATRMADSFREKALQMQHNDGSFHTATLKEKDEHGEGKQVFIVSGHVQMTPDGTMIDREASDKTIVIFDPSTGERKMIDPSSDFGLSSVDEPTTPEELEASIERERQGFIQAQLDDARGTIRLSVGQQFVLPDGNEAVVVALDESGEDITAMLADGTQVNIQRAELQQAHDEQALAEYRQRKGIEEPTAEDEEPEQPEQGTQGAQVDGAPSSYEPDMELVLPNERGGESRAMVMGRVRYEGGQFIPDENGGIVEYYMDGEVRHEQIGKLNDRVVSHTDAAQVIEEETPSAEDVQTEEETPLQEEESVPAEDDATPLDEEELAPAAEEDAEEENAMPMRDNGEEDWQATTPERAHSYIFNEAGLSRSEGNEFVAAQKDAAQRALNKAKSAQAPRVGTNIGQYKEAKAKHQEKIENAQRVLDYWNAVQDIQVAIQHKEREQKEAEDAKAHEEAAAQMQAEFEARKAAEAERAEEAQTDVASPAMTEDEYLASKGLGSPMSDHMLDKTRIPHGETARQKARREREAEKAMKEHAARKKDARKEYQEKLANGELREPTKEETEKKRIDALIRTANGHGDNPSVLAARRVLDKRGIDWQKKDGQINTQTEENNAHNSKEIMHGQKNVQLQQTTTPLTNDTEAKQKATETILTALNKAGIEVIQATDEQAQEMLGSSKAEPLKTPQGTVYGWTVNGKIYLTKSGLNPETPVHEYTHLWAEAMIGKNKQGWDSIKTLLKDTPVWNEVINDPNYSNIKDNEDAVASEVLSRISGRKNAAKMEAEAQKAINKAKGVLEKAKATTILLNLKRAIEQFWHWVNKNVFGIKDFKNIDEVTDRVLYDLLSNTKLTEEDNEEIAKRDKLYLDAVERGDMETAQRMVNEAAAQNGYVPNSEYQGSSAFNGAAPYGNGYFLTKEERKGAYENDEFDGDTSLDDYVNSGIDPMNLDYLTNDSSYRHADDARKEAIENLRNVFQNKRQTITMYRSVPSSIKEGSFRNGDWVTPSYAYAVENARMHGWGNKYRIIEQEVPISDVWFDGNDIAEFGYGNEDDFINDKDYLYSNTKNNQKLPDAVTYDDKGNVIPLSKRFNKAKSDPRFQIADSALSDEEKKIVETAKANDTYMKAPNGKPTNLNEKQWAQVRTKAFKNWFGDWEKAARIEKLRKSKPVKITEADYEGKYDLTRNSAKQWAKDNIRGEYMIADTGEKVNVSKVSINEVLSHGERDAAHLKSISSIGKLLHNAIFITETPNAKDNDKYESYRYYIEGVKIDGEDYTAKIVVGVKNGKTYYDHRLTKIEKGSLLDSLNGLSNSVAKKQQTPFTGKDSKLLSILRTNSSKVVDENGEPMVVYHGTLTKDLHQFSKDFIGSRYSFDEKGFFFISNKQIAKDYSYSEFDSTRKGEVIETFLSIKHPLLVDQKWCKKNGLGNNVFKYNDVIGFWDNYQALILEESENNDGVIITDGNTTMDVAFDPNQIKSAVNNNGEFSLESDDIRFRKEDGENQEVLRDKDLSTGPLRDREAMRNEAEQLAEKLHTPINVVEDANEITHPNKEIEARRRKAKGWYNVSTGEVVVVLANHKDAADVAATICHEVIAHKGLRELVGEAHYDEFLDEVYDHLSGDLKREIDDAAGRAFLDDINKSGDDARDYKRHRRIAVDELFGSLAEKPFEEFSESERSLWQKIKEFANKLLDRFLDKLKLPKWFELGDNELRYILWRSKERLERGKEDPIDQARDIVKREDLGLTNEPLNKVSVTARNFDEMAERYNWNWDFSQDKGMEDLYDIAPNVTTKDYYLGTFAEFELVATNDPTKWDELKQQDGFRLEHSPKSDSEYLINDETGEIYRKSDHWGVVSSCRWILNGMPHQDDKGKIFIGKSNVNDFKREKKACVVVTKGKREAYYARMREVAENIKQALGDKTIKFTATARKIVDENLRMLIPQIKRYDEGEKGDLIYKRNRHGHYVPLEILKTTNNNPLYDDNSGEDDVLYRDSGETRDIWLDQSMGLQERTTAAAARLANNHRDNKVFMQDAMRAIGANLTDLRKAMRLQKDFDRTTAKRVYDLARILMEMGYLRGLNQQEVSKLLSVMKNSIGKQNIDNDVQQLMDLMVNHQLKQSKSTLESLEHIKGSKVNAKGVEVQGALDAEGQAIMAAMKAAKDIVTPCAGKTEEDNGELTAWGQALEDVQERMGSEDNTIAENAALEYQGMMLAQQWFDEIKQRELEEASLRQELNHAQSTTPAEERKGEAYKEYIDNLKQAIQQNKIDRAQAYMNLVGQLTESLRESIEGAKAFKLREKARISAIQRDANLDMEGRPAGEHYVPDWKARAVNNAFVSGVAAPLATMDQMLRLFGNKSANGEGYLYNRFERGFVDARQQEIKGYREKTAILDAKAAEIFGGKIKTWADLIRYVSGLPDKEVVFKNGGIDERFTLSQGNLMYIYMVNKMLDGRLKLSKMGLTSDVVEELAKEIDPRLIKLADWMQEDFLVQTRNEYNETHKRVFGASMAAIENYFPLKIRSNARIDKAEDLDNPTRNSGISTTTGSIIKRRRNSLPLDLLNADALNIILDHITEMEHWNAFVEYNRDLNTLRTYKRFRNGVENMTTIYGSGKELWKHFNDLCQITTGSYIPPREDLDKSLVNLAKGVTAAKVSFRLFTALKQFLSFPAYFPEVKAVHIAKCLAHPKESWDWCMENLPIFNERWNSRLSGDPRLLKTNMDWKMWRTRAAEIAMRIGMTPNAFVDALTVCIGARAMYMTRKGQYLRDGYTEEEADKRAKQDAETLYNQTQQSSEGAFLSRMQVDRGWISVLFSIFRNSSMAYTRQVYDAMRNLRRNLTPGGRKESIAFMTKQYMNEGFDKAKAEENAKRKFDRQIRKDILRVATFGYLLQFAWNLGAYLPYMLFGGDDDEKEVFWQDVFAHSYFGSLEGLTGGDVISQVLGSYLAGNLNPNSMDKDMPLTSDLALAFKEFAKGDKDAALSDMINLIVQSGIGVNPQSITDSVLAIMDACGDDPALANEATIFIARILQVPQSQIDKLYFDEVGLMGSGLSKYTPAQLAARYARYKVKRGHFSTPWAWDDDVNIGKAMTKANREIKERTNHMGLTNLNEAFAPYEEVYQKVDKQMDAYEAAKKTDYVKAANMMVEIQKDKSALDTYQKLKSMDSQLDKMAKRFLSAKSDGERQLYRKMIESYKPAMLKVLQAKGEAAQEKAMDDIGTLMEGFAEEQEKLYENQ